MIAAFCGSLKYSEFFCSTATHFHIIETSKYNPCDYVNCKFLQLLLKEITKVYQLSFRQYALIITGDLVFNEYQIDAYLIVVQVK